LIDRTPLERPDMKFLGKNVIATKKGDVTNSNDLWGVLNEYTDAFCRSC